MKLRDMDGLYIGKDINSGNLIFIIAMNEQDAQDIADQYSENKNCGYNFRIDHISEYCDVINSLDFITSYPLIADRRDLDACRCKVTDIRLD